MENLSTPHSNDLPKETICYCTPEECDCTVTREEKKMNKTEQENCKYVLDYDNKCDCREDDNCGCTYPNNLPQDFKQECKEGQNCTAQQSDTYK